MRICVVVFAVLCGIACVRSEGKYTSKYDNVNLDEILGSDHLLTNYANCLLEKGKCTPDGAELKNVLHEALESECGRCTEKQKEGAKTVIRFLLKNKRDLWNKLQAKYDPDKKYVKKYQDELKAQGLTL